MEYALFGLREGKWQPSLVSLSTFHPGIVAARTSKMLKNMSVRLSSQFLIGSAFPIFFDGKNH